MISQTELKRLLYYEPLSGNFIRLITKCSRAKVGQIAGTTHPLGYIKICLNKKIYSAHRLAYLYQTGEWPPFEVDHINGNKSDNSWVNLRLATSSQNKANREWQNNHAENLEVISTINVGCFHQIAWKGCNEVVE